MSIVLGALGGAGAAAQEAGATMMKSDLDTQRQIDVGTAMSNLELQRQEALEQFKVSVANQQREAQAGRIDAAAQPIIQQGIVAKASAARASKLPDYDPDSDASAPASFHGDAGQALAAINALPDGPDKQAALAQFKANFAQNKANVGTLSMNDLTDTEKTQSQPSASDITRARTQAAIGTGDISPTEAAKLASSSEINQMKMDALLQRSEDRNATMKEVADVRAEALKYGYELRLQAAQEKRLNGKIDTATTRMLITSEDANIRASTSQLGMINTQLSSGSVPSTKNGKPNPEYEGLKSQMESLRADIAESKKRKLDLFKGLNIVPKDESDNEDADTAAPAPATRPPLSNFMK